MSSIPDFGQSSSLDWLRLCQSKGKELAGPGGRSDLEVSKVELRKHRKRKDAWIMIKGNPFVVVYEN